MEQLLHVTTAGLHGHGLRWKPDEKLTFAANQQVEGVPSALVVPDFRGGQYEIPRTKTIDAVGHSLDIEGAPAEAILHRMTAMTQHFWNRRFLLDKTAPLSLRIWRYGQTVRASPLYGAGTFRYTQELATRTSGTDLRLVRSMWRPARRPATLNRPRESWGEWQKRTYKTASLILARAGVPKLLEGMVRSKHQWAGHLARMPDDAVPKLLSRWRDTEWWERLHNENMRLDPRNRTGWKHNRPGEHNRWDLALHNHYGEAWRTLAQDRDNWKALEDSWADAELRRLDKGRKP